jgi:hypothetical protein
MPVSPSPWLVAAIAFIVLGCSRGIHASFGVFNVALLDAFGWSRGATAAMVRRQLRLTSLTLSDF